MICSTSRSSAAHVGPYVFGSGLLLLFVVQLVTGLLLMTSYAPSAQSAWASVVHIQNANARRLASARPSCVCDASDGALLLGAHLLQVAIYGAYQRPREVNWWLGLLLLAMTLGFALDGQSASLGSKRVLGDARDAVPASSARCHSGAAKFKPF